MNTCRICDSNDNVGEHHIIFKSSNRPLQHCKINLIELCQEHHREVHKFEGEVLDRELKLIFQNRLELGLTKRYFTFNEIKKFLGISKNETLKLLKDTDDKKGMYEREDIIKACMKENYIFNNDKGELIMGEEFQRAIDHDNLEQARKNLNEFTGRINSKTFYTDIINTDNKNFDELHLKFIQKNPNLNFEEIQIVKQVFDFIKSQNK